MVSKGGDHVVLYPHYFDANLSRAQGRRVGQDVAVSGPDCKWIEVAAKRANLTCTVEDQARAPRLAYEKTGRVLVEKTASKESIVDAVAKQMRESQDRRESR